MSLPFNSESQGAISKNSFSCLLNIVTCDRGVGMRTPFIRKRTVTMYRLPKVRPKNLTFGGRYTRFLSQSLCVSFHINNYLLCTIYFISVILIFFAKFFTSAGITFPTSDCCAFDMPQAIAYLTHSFKG